MQHRLLGGGRGPALESKHVWSKLSPPKSRLIRVGMDIRWPSGAAVGPLRPAAAIGPARPCQGILETSSSAFGKAQVDDVALPVLF